MGISETQMFGFAENVQKLLEKERVALKKGGIDIDAVLTTLESLIEVAVAANASQHDLRRPKKKVEYGCGHRQRGTREDCGRRDLEAQRDRRSSPQ